VNTVALSWSALPLPSFVLDKPSMAESAIPDDDALVASALGGDETAFTELVRRHKRRVFSAASRFARDDHQLDDLCQEVFIRAFRHLSKFRGEAPFEHWLSRITVSACYDFLRKERRTREQISLDAHDFDLRDSRCDASASARGASELLAFAMRQLSADERLIITLAEIEDRSMREISELTGWSESNVKVRAFRARQNLKKILESSHER
jgi:RNA polymerase sigma-70 factor (ECF subfamily)